MTTLYTDNFDAATVGTLPTGWTSISGNWQVNTTSPASGHTKSFTSGDKGDGNAAILTGPAASADMEVAYSFVVTSGATSAAMVSLGPMLRMNSAYTSGYVVLIAGGLTPNLILFERSGGGFSNLGTIATGVTFAPGDKFNMRAQIIGSRIRAKVWKNAVAEPSTWAMDITNTDVTAPGYTGFYYATDGSSGDVGATDMTLTNAGAAVVAPTIAPNNAGILYSPGNWDAQAARALSINAGAYLKTLFTGASCTLNFDASALVAPLSQISYRIDGFGPWTVVPVAATVVCTMPADTAAYGSHLLEVVVKSTTETQARWAGTATAVRFTGLTLASGATVALPGSATLSGLIFGDSITEGVRTVNMTATNDTDRNDAKQGWAYDLGRLLGAEIGVVGFGATGWLTVGSGGVPALPTSYSSIYSGVARSFANLDFVIINMGTNDGSTDTTSVVTSTLNGLLAALPAKTKIFVLRPFNGTAQASFLQAGIAACLAPSRVVYIDTAGFFNSADSSDALHPYGFANLGYLAPKIAAAIKPNLGARRFTVSLAA